jgi:hypothetical protein
MLQQTLSSLKVEVFNNEKNYLPNIFTWKSLILSKTSFSHLKNLQHVEEISSAPPTHLERLLLSLQPCKLKPFPQKDSPFLCCTRKHFQKLKGNKFPKTFTKTWKTFLALQTSMLEISKNLKNFLSHFWTWNLQLKDLKNTLPHLRTYNTLKKSLPHLPPTWKCCKLLVCHHLEMNSHSLCKLKTLSQNDSFLFSYAIQAQTFHYFLF